MGRPQDATTAGDGGVPGRGALAVRRCLEAVEILFKESGASGVRSSSPLCRAYDDLRAINNHGLLKLETNMEMYGRLLLDQEPNTPLI